MEDIEQDIVRNVDATRDAAARVRTTLNALEAMGTSLCLPRDVDDWQRYKEAKRLIDVASEMMEQAKTAYQDARCCWQSVEKATIAHPSRPLIALARDAALSAYKCANSDCNKVSNLVYKVHQNCKDVIKQLGEVYRRQSP